MERKDSHKRGLGKGRNRGQSLVAVIVAMAAALTVTIGVIDSTRYFGKGVKGVEDSVRFGLWTTNLTSILAGRGAASFPAGNYTCPAAFSGVVLNVTSCQIICQTLPVAWPAYCTGSATAQPDQASCIAAGGTWNTNNYLVAGTAKEGMTVQSVQLCTDSAALSDLGSGNYLYRMLLRVKAQKAGTTTSLTWQKYFNAELSQVAANQYKIVDCTINASDPSATDIVQTSMVFTVDAGSNAQYYMNGTNSFSINTGQEPPSLPFQLPKNSEICAQTVYENIGKVAVTDQHVTLTGTLGATTLTQTTDQPASLAVGACYNNPSQQTCITPTVSGVWSLKVCSTAATPVDQNTANDCSKPISLQVVDY